MSLCPIHPAPGTRFQRPSHTEGVALTAESRLILRVSLEEKLTLGQPSCRDPNKPPPQNIKCAGSEARCQHGHKGGWLGFHLASVSHFLGSLCCQMTRPFAADFFPGAHEEQARVPGKYLHPFLLPQKCLPSPQCVTKWLRGQEKDAKEAEERGGEGCGLGRCLDSNAAPSAYKLSGACSIFLCLSFPFYKMGVIRASLRVLLEEQRKKKKHV